MSEVLQKSLQARFAQLIQSIETAFGEVTITVDKAHVLDVMRGLHTDKSLHFEQLIDLCGVDYLHYGQDEWQTSESTSSGFGRGCDRSYSAPKIKHPRFAVVYHLLSIHHNHRLRVKVFLKEDDISVDSVVGVWPSANWYEREAFDLFGIKFLGHPDLRRILTDYEFKGHPFRKDFPLVGEVEMRYDAAQGRCVYEPVQITPRTLVPKVCREDNRYLKTEAEDGGN